jgi:hypothetical protein
VRQCHECRCAASDHAKDSPTHLPSCDEATHLTTGQLDVIYNGRRRRKETQAERWVAEYKAMFPDVTDAPSAYLPTARQLEDVAQDPSREVIDEMRMYLLRVGPEGLPGGPCSAETFLGGVLHFIGFVRRTGAVPASHGTSTAASVACATLKRLEPGPGPQTLSSPEALRGVDGQSSSSRAVSRGHCCMPRTPRHRAASIESLGGKLSGVVDGNVEQEGGSDLADLAGEAMDLVKGCRELEAVLGI